MMKKGLLILGFVLVAFGFYMIGYSNISNEIMENNKNYYTSQLDFYKQIIDDCDSCIMNLTKENSSLKVCNNLENYVVIKNE